MDNRGRVKRLGVGGEGRGGGGERDILYVAKIICFVTSWDRFVYKYYITEEEVM